MYSSVIIFIIYFLEILKETYNNHIQEKVQIYQAGTRGKRGVREQGDIGGGMREGEWEKGNGKSGMREGRRENGKGKMERGKWKGEKLKGG